MDNAIAWVLACDKQLVSVTSNTGKELKSIAEALFDVTKSRGVTEMRMVDYTMQPLEKAQSYIQMSLSAVCIERC